jgi:hypothetical protein
MLLFPLYSALGNYGVFRAFQIPTKNELNCPGLPDNVCTQAVRSKLLQGQEEIENAEWDKIIQEKNFATASANLTWPLLPVEKLARQTKLLRLK